ncbi:hypothetical protein SAMN05421738_101154 [Algoriella xinjiangensis]|uniref:Uncharacterized protein n=1 Tax=Algoriella xinjiangensis TaxID=684065 RepID=A0A1I4SCQ3_9FLAO|nr:hypothetical protein [Algoriella xinjiangensis]SFM62257.1 hypothetical protein SAMN05421738_101154 [Algoriella xinjiangensis]VDH16007.1 Uncharacterised protein [Algoriella xinjiangensis]
MIQIENYLQRAWSDSEDNVTLDDIILAIDELKEMDDENDAIWVSVIGDDENIIEVRKNLSLIIDFEDDDLIESKANSWDEVIELYKLLLNKEFDQIIEKVK